MVLTATSAFFQFVFFVFTLSLKPSQKLHLHFGTGFNGSLPCSSAPYVTCLLNKANCGSEQRLEIHRRGFSASLQNDNYSLGNDLTHLKTSEFNYCHFFEGKFFASFTSLQEIHLESRGVCVFKKDRRREILRKASIRLCLEARQIWLPCKLPHRQLVTGLLILPKLSTSAFLHGLWNPVLLEISVNSVHKAWKFWSALSTKLGNFDKLYPQSLEISVSSVHKAWKFQSALSTKLGNFGKFYPQNLEILVSSVHKAWKFW